MTGHPDTLVERAGQLFPPELLARVDGGARVVGTTCVATPRELFDALGLVPYRLRALGSHRRDRADSVMSRFNCSFCRSCLQLALCGEFDLLDGLVETNGCDHLRGMFEGWQAHRPPGFFHYLRVPHLVHDDAVDAFAHQLEGLWDALVRHFDLSPEPGALGRAMNRQRRVRALWRRLHALRRRRKPALSGAEALAVMLLESAVPADAFEALLTDLVRRREARPPAMPHRARLLLAGGATDELHLVEALEELGGLVVADGLCHGGRALFRAEEPDAPTLRALARTTLRSVLCPRMFEEYPQRLDHLHHLAQGAGADGAVLVHNKFCDLHGVDNLMLANDLERRGLPVLVLEKEYGPTADLGRYLTRVQAFIERIET